MTWLLNPHSEAPMPARFAPLALLLVVALVGAHAQKVEATPKRPKLWANADTNEAQAYYDHGFAQLKDNPSLAADAFYWAYRLNPTRADAFYARRVALLLSNPDRLAKYWRGERNTLRSDDIKRIDSLYLQALTLNPFFYEGLERRLQDEVIAYAAKRDGAAYGVSSGEIEYAINRYLANADAGEKAFRAYADGRFDEALSLYASAAKSGRNKYYFRMMRGRLFFQLGNADSALTELTLAVEEMRKKDAKDLIYVYQSKALLEQAIGMAHYRRGELDKAREALGRALQEDLSYSSAHTQLGYLALEAKDTTTAIAEFDLAAQLRSDDAGLRYQYGYILLETGKLAEAEEQLRKAAELNPVYALPRYGLGRLHEKQGKNAEAAAQYQAFLSLASRQDPRRAEIEQRVRTLGTP